MSDALVPEQGWAVLGGSMLAGIEQYVRSVEAAMEGCDYFVPIPHQDLHWLIAFAHRLLQDGKTVECQHPGYKDPVPVEVMAKMIQRAIDEAVLRRRS